MRLALLASLLLLAACTDDISSNLTVREGTSNETKKKGEVATASDDTLPATEERDAPSSAIAAPPAGPFVGSAWVDDRSTYNFGGSDGDLWPSCWGDDDALYTANGDGKGLGPTFDDIVVNRVLGAPPNLSGQVLARSGAVSKIWTAGRYNRKPTGMVCVDGAIYLAVQDLNTDFMDAPAATISVSRDHGKTWQFDAAKPMFDNHVMTTLWFVDYGKNNANAPDNYVYAYALDQNWRFSSRVESPTKLWLARVPKDQIQNRAAWTYYAGNDASGQPRFAASIADRAPVLEDATKVYQKPYDPAFASNMTTLSQGGVVYDAPLHRYIYASWTEFTFELFEAPQPWGPWKKFLRRDYGVYPWFGDLNGGYATTIPSKFLSADGTSMWLQSNTFTGGQRNYSLSFRKMTLNPADYAAEAANAPSASPIPGGTPVYRAAHAGPSLGLVNGNTTDSTDSWTGEEKSEDYWGETWSTPQTVNRVVYTAGKMFSNGGWFETLRLQLRIKGEWRDAAASSSPAYPTSAAAGPNKAYTFDVAPQAVDGVRVIGKPGGANTFTSAAEVAAFNAL